MEDVWSYASWGLFFLVLEFFFLGWGFEDLFLEFEARSLGLAPHLHATPP